MPILRGLEIAVVAGADAVNLPEYPHPDGSSVRLLSPGDGRSAESQSPGPSDSSVISDGDPTRQKKFNPRISVYIPSMPGEQFWLRYTVLRITHPTTHLFFKMYMNGRLITSWGILAKSDDTKSQRPIHGTVVRALYDPGERWDYRGTGMQGKAVGIEARYFHFMPAMGKSSIAEDGGLIEVQVFRSKGRQRRAPKMTEFRSQDRYGIASPSGGLVENPQDTTYYDWLLIDPKDSPYASFRFHYRSMENLLQLNLIPQSDSRMLLPLPDLSFPEEQHAPVSHEKTPGYRVSATSEFAFDDKTFEGTGVSNGCRIGRTNLMMGQKFRENCFLQIPPALHPAAITRQNIPQPSKVLRQVMTQEVLDRPLPDPPGLKARSSQSSLRSNCPSLTPSIANYVNNGTFGDDEVSIGTAHTIMCSVPSMVDLPERKSEVSEGNSMSDYENSPPSSTASQCPDLPSPLVYLSTTGSVLEQYFAQYSSPPLVQPSPRRIRSRMPLSASENTALGDSIVLRPGVLSLTESEWMRRTPSPAQRKSIGQLWSPRLGKKPTGLSPKGSSPRSRFSDLGPRSSNETLGEHDASSESAYSSEATHYNDGEAFDGSPAPRPFGAKEPHVPTEINNTSEYSAKRNTWEAGRKLQCYEYGVGERPPGNWI